MSSSSTRLTGSSNTSPSTRRDEGDGSPSSARRSPRRTTGGLTIGGSNSRSQRSLNASLEQAGSGDRTIELLTPQATSTPGAAAPRTLTQRSGFERSRSVFDFSQGSNLRRAATVVGTIGLGYFASSYLPPGVSQIVTNFAHSAFYTQVPLQAPLTVPLTPTQLLQAASGSGSQLNLTTVGLASLFAVTTAASMSPSVRSAAAGAARSAADLLTPSRKRKESQDQPGGSGSASDVNNGKRAKKNENDDDSDVDDSGLRLVDESYVGKGASKKKAKRPSDDSVDRNSDEAGPAGVSEDELQRRHNVLSTQQKQLKGRLQDASEAHTPNTVIRTTRAATSVISRTPKSVAEKEKATVRDAQEKNPNDTDPEFYTDVAPLYKNLTATQQKLIQGARTHFCSAGGKYLSNFAYGKPIRHTSEVTLIDGTPLRVMRTQYDFFIKAVDEGRFEDAHDYLISHKPGDVSTLNWNELNSYKSGETFSIPTKTSKGITKHLIEALTKFDEYMLQAQRMERVLSNRNLEELIQDDSE